MAPHTMSRMHAHAALPSVVGAPVGNYMPIFASCPKRPHERSSVIIHFLPPLAPFMVRKIKAFAPRIIMEEFNGLAGQNSGANDRKGS
jgi:hypothetical protein